MDFFGAVIGGFLLAVMVVTCLTTVVYLIARSFYEIARAPITKYRKPAKMFLDQPRKASALLILWTTINATVWIFFGEGQRGAWAPFSKYSRETFSLAPYGKQEFFVYAVIPWIAYVVYRLLTSSDPTAAQKP